jgi:hypothetical protein
MDGRREAVYTSLIEDAESDGDCIPRTWAISCNDDCKPSSGNLDKLDYENKSLNLCKTMR